MDGTDACVPPRENEKRQSLLDAFSHTPPFTSFTSPPPPSPQIEINKETKRNKGKGKKKRSMTGKFLTSSVTRSSALSLYRSILRTSKHFHHCDESGRPWNGVLRAAARKEFEEGRGETDPLVAARLIVTGEECLRKIGVKFNQVDKEVEERINKERNRR